jgi:uncharacterized protein
MTSSIPTSLTDQSRAVAEKIYSAAVRGDMKEVLSYLHDDVVVSEPDYLPYGGKYVGKDGLLQLLRDMQQYVAVSKISVDYLVADGERVIAIIRIPDVKTGRLTCAAEELTMRDGRVSEIRLYFHDTQSMIAAAPTQNGRH